MLSPLTGPRVAQHDTREAAALCRRRLETLARLTGGDLSRVAEAALRLASPGTRAAPARSDELTADPSAHRSAPTAANPLSDTGDASSDRTTDDTLADAGDTAAELH